ncbi:peptide chain release factor N(5)-glutamine methyltransferase [Pseudanabaena sp. FACHB-2040]|uniref:peptide chain release factor N(5)-glutamine methyltransferase n=1 Tax=Pseudanabaena sp. FACHB-2040 TaxID=2692859 RepID=UPI001685E265|nr:peptide chain release factor N(5)-glutamine methyltransferase [Pseudanabaena sp. FACHB-2040]MBD2257419.1 peptide chain release factor N(5)-glutamine methyltransferase [Pseudanabaena sp. FACHB-2040]
MNLGSDSLAPKHTVAGKDLWQWWQAARQQAQSTAIDSAEVDWLLRAVSNVDSLALRLGTFKQHPVTLVGVSLEGLTELWQQRVEQRVPVQYLVGWTSWRDLTLKVSPAVLIPRPETELIIDLALDAIHLSPQAEQLQQGIWVDMGTGSGAIALALAKALPKAQIYAVDVSAVALATARENARLNGLEPRITFCEGAWFAPLAELKGQVAGLVSNPPYIPTATVQGLEPEVVNHEPTLALDGGPDGLDAMRELIKTAPDYLCSGGFWLAEMMSGQSPAVRALLEQQGTYRAIQVHSDLAGIERFSSAFRI